MNIQPTTYTSQLPKLLTNGKRLATNYAHYLSQNSSTLKTNALVISSLILVLSRIAIAQGSAKKASGTPEGPFRYREAIRTTIREAAGWTLSFMVLRTFEFAVKKGLVNYFKINFAPAVQNAAHTAEEALKAGTEQFIKKHELGATGLFKSIGTFGKNMVDFIRNKPFETVAAQKGAYYGSQFFQFSHPERFKQWEGLINLFSANKNAPAVDRLKNFYQWFPLLMGSIPAITLSGYAL
ncbi:MAG: hypothetical protein K2X66_13080, partial [Cyanobacteria bacterium]|nr:hypothetical protein [Cyanobacteriota bacterium]